MTGGRREGYDVMTTIRLLGPPAVEHDGRPARPPRGRKAWALLAYLVLAERPPSRMHLAELLFADADDPLGALRWTLAELRRTLDTPEAFTGDPVVAGLGPDVDLDIAVLSEEYVDPGPLLRIEGELLDGLSLPSCLEFESWLLVARYRVSSAVEAQLRQAAMGLLAAGQPAEAVRYASRALSRGPLDEGNHELLVRCLAMAGDPVAARRQVAVCEDLLRRELGVTPSDALRDAATTRTSTSIVPPLRGPAAARSQLEAGQAAIAAGAVDAGIQSLRRAAVEAGRGTDAELRGRVLVALGSALVHACRGRDEEGAVVLRQAIELATRAGDRTTAVTAHRELGFIEVQAARRTTAEFWLVKAHELAESDADLAAVLGVRGMNASDFGDYPTALERLTESADLARKCGDARQEAWTLAILGRAHLLRGEQTEAAAAVARSLELATQERWMAFLPWPQVLTAEVDRRAGDPGSAADRLEHAWALACQVDDPCWEGFAARSLGLLHAEQGDQVGAWQWLHEAMVRCTRVPDQYQWLHAYVLDAVAATALAAGEAERAHPLVASLGSLAARGDMRELVVRAQLHRARLGDATARRAARLLAEHIDNPVLTELLDSGGDT
jgi:DNA-binding SARP family transcriptional activator